MKIALLSLRTPALSVWFFSALILASRAHAEGTPPLTTKAEQTHWKETGRYSEVISLCSEFERSYPKQVQCLKFGETPEGRPMMALVASSDGVLDPVAAKEKKRPVVLAQGGIHAGEIDGKDAGFLILRELLQNNPAGGSAGNLSKFTFVFVPVFNIDGHERFGKNNRPNQIGPEEMGWRVTAQNLNLNRDYVKAQAPEMVAMLKLLNQWDPLVYLDLHVTDGADFQHEIAVIIEPRLKGPDSLRGIASKLNDEVQTKLAQQKHLPLPFYPEFETPGDPASGFAEGISPPRLSHPYWALHNRIGILVETHSWKNYATRVGATHDTLRAVFDAVAREGKSWLETTAKEDARQTSLQESSTVLSYDHTEHSERIDFQGYAYRREVSPISGQLMTTYDPTKPEIWKIPFFSELKPKLTVIPPKAGYLVPAAHAAWVADKLTTHGIRFEVIREAKPSLEVETYRAKEAELSKTTFEGRTTLTLKGAWAKEKRDLPAGSLFVPLGQPARRLVLHLFEPEARDSLVSWGFFNSAFEQKEYMEAYVTEKVAAEMLAKNPVIRAEFNQKLSQDAEFAKDPEKRLDFFYRKHPSYDERYNLYPVYRTARKP